MGTAAFEITKQREQNITSKVKISSRAMKKTVRHMTREANKRSEIFQDYFMMMKILDSEC
jgi:hypothetical protein